MLAQTAAFADPRTPADSSMWSNTQASGQTILTLDHYDPLFFDGDKSEFIYEVLEGVVASFSILADGRRQILGFHFSGDVLGLSHDGEYHSHSCAIGETRVRRIPRASLMRIARDRPEIVSRLLECATSQLVGMQNHFVLLGRKSAQEKMASFLLVLARRHAGEEAQSVVFQLPMSRSEIADYLGLTIETVSRTLTKLRIAGVIDLPRSSTVDVHNMKKLEKLAGNEDDCI